MQLLNIAGRKVRVNLAPYSVQWDAPSLSKPQFLLKQFLKQYWVTDHVVEEMLIPGTKLRADFINFSRNILLEMSGKQHFIFNKHYHNNDRLKFLKGIKNDEKKKNWASMNALKFVEIKDSEIKLLNPIFFRERFDIALI